MADEAEDDGKAISAIMAALKPLKPDGQVHVLNFVVKRLGITLDAPATPSLAGQLGTATPPPTPQSPGQSIVDIRTFAKEKKPQTVNEKVALVAYYLANLAPADERRDFIKTDDIKPYFDQANFELPTAPERVTLGNAKNAGYLNATATPGQFRLNAVGHNLIAHKLPLADGTPSRPARKKAARKKAKL